MLLLVVSGMVFVDTIFFTAITPLLPHYVHRFHLSKAEAGLLVAAYPAGTLLAAVPTGLLAGRAGVRRAVVIGLSLMSAATLAFGLGASAPVLEAARFVQGIGGACTWAGGLAWVASGAPPDRRAHSLGVAFSAAVGGSLFGPVVGTIASKIGTAPTFAGATVVAVCLMVASLLVNEPAGEKPPTFGSAWRAVREPSVGAGMWLTALSGLAFGVVDVLVPLRLNALGASAVGIGATFLAAAALEGVLAPVVGRLADRRGRLLPVRLSVTLAIGVSLAIPFASPAPILAAVVIAGMSAFSTLFVPAAALISDGSRRLQLHQGLGFGLANLAWAAGQAIAAGGSGAVAQSTSDTVPYVVLAIVFFTTLCALRERVRALLGEFVFRAAAPFRT